MIIECLRDNRGRDVPRNLLSLQKIQEERCVRSRERGIFPVVTIEEDIVGEYVRCHKGMKSVVSSLKRCREIENGVRV